MVFHTSTIMMFALIFVSFTLLIPHLQLTSPSLPSQPSAIGDWRISLSLANLKVLNSYNSQNSRTSIWDLHYLSSKLYGSFYSLPSMSNSILDPDGKTPAVPVQAQSRTLSDVCAQWFHARCLGISTAEYRSLQLSDESWSCKRCLAESLPFHNISSSDSVFDISIHSGSLDPPAPVYQPPQKLSVLYTNCRSLLPRIDYFRALAASESPHLLGICETLDNSITNDELHIPQYDLHHRDRNRHGGGIAIYPQFPISYYQTQAPTDRTTCCWHQT